MTVNRIFFYFYLLLSVAFITALPILSTLDKIPKPSRPEDFSEIKSNIKKFLRPRLAVYFPVFLLAFLATTLIDLAYRESPLVIIIADIVRSQPASFLGDRIAIVFFLLTPACIGSFAVYFGINWNQYSPLKKQYIVALSIVPVPLAFLFFNLLSNPISPLPNHVPIFLDDVLFLFGMAIVIAGITSFAIYQLNKKTPEQLEAEKTKAEAELKSRQQFYSSLSSTLDPYQAALIKFPLNYYETASPLTKKLRTDIETIKNLIMKLCPDEANQYLHEEVTKGNARSPDAILLNHFPVASLATRNVKSLPLPEMQAFLFALWKDLLSVVNPEDITPEKLSRVDAVPRLTPPAFYTLKDTYGEGVAEILQDTTLDKGLRPFIDDFSRALDREVVPHLARRGFQVIGYCRQTFQAYQRNNAEDAAIPPDFRFQHLYITGKTGAGKTTLLQNLISQDINRGDGIIVFSPENDLFENLLHYIPRHRADDLIYFDPSDTTSLGC